MIYSGDLYAENMTKDNTIPPQAYMTTADLGRFVDCIFRVINCSARAHVGWPVSGREVLQVLHLADLLYTEIFDERVEAVKRDRPNIEPQTLDMATSARYNRLPMRSHLQHVADEEVRQYWTDILMKYFEKEEQE